MLIDIALDSFMHVSNFLSLVPFEFGEGKGFREQIDYICTSRKSIHTVKGFNYKTIMRALIY